jgi:PAS domain S-box-containing protein
VSGRIQDMLEVAVELSPCLFVVLDSENRIFFFNRACEELTGYKREEVLGKSLLDLFVPVEWIPEVRKRLSHPEAIDIRAPCEDPWITRSGETRLIEWRCAVLTCPQGGHYLMGSGVDITACRRKEAELQNLQAEIARLCRLTTVGELAAGLAHELNQPLGAIVGYAQGCKLRLDRMEGETGELSQALGQIMAMTRRAGEIIHRLRNFVRTRAPRRSTVSVNKLVQDIISFVQHEMSARGVALKLELSEDLPSVEADSIQIQQVILNLLRNGLEAMETVPESDRRLTVRTSLVTPEEVEVAVSDTGPPVSEELLDRSFEQFRSTKPEGLGLGLSISKSIIEAHQGTLWATANPDRGANFRFRLPVKNP